MILSDPKRGGRSRGNRSEASLPSGLDWVNGDVSEIIKNYDSKNYRKNRDYENDSKKSRKNRVSSSNEDWGPNTKLNKGNNFCSNNQSSTDKKVNKLVHEVSRMSADYCNKKTWLKMTSINLNKDEMCKRILGIEQP